MKRRIDSFQVFRSTSHAPRAHVYKFVTRPEDEPLYGHSRQELKFNCNPEPKSRTDFFGWVYLRQLNRRDITVLQWHQKAGGKVMFMLRTNFGAPEPELQLRYMGEVWGRINLDNLKPWVPVRVEMYHSFGGDGHIRVTLGTKDGEAVFERWCPTLIDDYHSCRICAYGPGKIGEPLASVQWGDPVLEYDASECDDEQDGTDY